MVLRAHLAPIVARLERAQPQLAAGGPCLEYPWEDPTGAVLWPARDLAIAKEFVSIDEAFDAYGVARIW